MNNQAEYNFIQEGQKTFSSSVTYWIGGSTDATGDIDYTNDYIENDSGNMMTITHLDASM